MIIPGSERAFAKAAHRTRPAEIEVRIRRRRGRLACRKGLRETRADADGVAGEIRQMEELLQFVACNAVLHIAAGDGLLEGNGMARARGRKQRAIARIVTPAGRELKIREFR